MVDADKLEEEQLSMEQQLAQHEIDRGESATTMASDQAAATTLVQMQQGQPTASDQPTASNSKHAKKNSTPTKGKSKLSLTQKVSPTIHMRGSSRRAKRFISGHAGGIPKLLPSTDKPIKTKAEISLFSSLLTTCKLKGKRKVDYAAMRVAFNDEYVRQTFSKTYDPKTVGPDIVEHLVFPKSIKMLKQYHTELDRTARVRENVLYNMAAEKCSLPQGAYGQRNITTFLLKQQDHTPTSQPASQPAQQPVDQPPLQTMRVTATQLDPMFAPSPSNSPTAKKMRQSSESAPEQQGLVQKLYNVATSAIFGGGPSSAATVTQPTNQQSSAKVKYMCTACALLNLEVTLKEEHPKVSGRGVCPVGNKVKELEEAIEAAKKIMKLKAGTKFNAREYIMKRSKEQPPHFKKISVGAKVQLGIQ